MVTIVLFGIGLVFLVKGADFLVDGASSIAKRLKISELTIGLTVVAFGTSSPELAVNILSCLSGNTQIAIGNILGSNIANILLILGVAAIIAPLTIRSVTIRYEIPLSLLAAILLGICVHERWLTHTSFVGLTYVHGGLFLFCFAMFMLYTFCTARSAHQENKPSVKEYGLPCACGLTMVGLVGLTLGGKWVVDGAVELATICGVSQAVIGLTVVAIGTSLPELATSAVAAYKKNYDIAVGNIIGSNIFNIFLVLGISSVITPLPFMNSSNLDVGMGIFITILLWLFVFRKSLLARWHGIVFLLLYIGYLTFRVAFDKSF